MEELWKDIPGYEGLYQVSNMGRVKSLSRKKNGKGGSHSSVKERILKQNYSGSCAFVALCKYGVQKSKTVTPLVAEAFLEKVEGCNTVLHIDGDNRNNCVSNLKWGKHVISENLRGYYKKKSKAVIGYSEKEDDLVCYPSLSATRKDGFSPSLVLRCCNGTLTNHKGYKWEYADEVFD